MKAYWGAYHHGALNDGQSSPISCEPEDAVLNLVSEGCFVHRGLAGRVGFCVRGEAPGWDVVLVASLSGERAMRGQPWRARECTALAMRSVAGSVLEDTGADTTITATVPSCQDH